MKPLSRPPWLLCGAPGPRIWASVFSMGEVSTTGWKRKAQALASCRISLNGIGVSHSR